jgi:hypothetical protein
MEVATAGLTEAWAEVDSLLPEGWNWSSVVFAPRPRTWLATVNGPVSYTGRRPNARPIIQGEGATVAEAVIALAWRIRKVTP